MTKTMSGLRGRKALPDVESEQAAYRVAEVLHSNCGIQGCKPKFHFEEAWEIFQLLERDNFIVVKDKEC